MSNGSHGPAQQPSLVAEYLDMLQDAATRERAFSVERKAQVERALAHRVKADFIANMSHELRTPLNTVLGFSRLLRDHDRNRLKASEIAMYADLIADAASSLLSFVNDVLEYAKVQGGENPLVLQDVDAADVVSAVTERFAERARQAGIALSVRVSPDLGEIVADAGRIMRALGNILDNALKFGSDNGEVHVDAAPTPCGGVRVSVRDNGKGIGSDDIALVLEPFWQADAGRDRVRNGAGLGLPLARAFVELHGGHLEIRCRPTGGTEVTMHLPAIARPRSVAHATGPKPLRSGIGA